MAALTPSEKQKLLARISDLEAKVSEFVERADKALNAMELKYSSMEKRVESAHELVIALTRKFEDNMKVSIDPKEDNPKVKTKKG